MGYHGIIHGFLGLQHLQLTPGSSTTYGRTVWWFSKKPSVSTWLKMDNSPLKKTDDFRSISLDPFLAGEIRELRPRMGWREHLHLKPAYLWGKNHVFGFQFSLKSIHLSIWGISCPFRVDELLHSSIFFSYFSTFFLYLFHIFIRFRFCFQIFPIFFPLPSIPGLGFSRSRTQMEMKTKLQKLQAGLEPQL